MLPLTLLRTSVCHGRECLQPRGRVARYIGTDHAVSVSSGTDALILAMIALDVRDPEVINTPFSFVATNTSIIRAGGVPASADISDD